MLQKPIAEPTVILEKVRQWCASSERCTREVERKLLQWGYPATKTKDAIDQLKKEGFVDDERYARAFARGKFHNLKWGKLKIVAELKARGLTTTIIQAALEEIPEEEYRALVEKELYKKKASLKTSDNWSQRAALLRFAASRGYESTLVNRILGASNDEEFNNLIEE
ncbi:MAG: regulatory protein RecX [Bacteroidales bacterium]